MNIIILNSRRGHSRNLPLPRMLPWLAALVLIVVPALVGTGSYYAARWFSSPVMDREMTERWQSELREKQARLGELDQRAEEELSALTGRLAEMQARLMRLDALGERLVDVAGVSSDEFDFGVAPGLGGPAMPTDREGARPTVSAPITDSIRQLERTLERREHQLGVLENLMDNRRKEEQTWLSGRPVKSGWMSSRFGTRTDPFSGRETKHRGVDFAAKEGTPIHATGAGVVTYASRRWGYGNLVEVNHGDGVKTRYAHIKDILVETGDIVRAGDKIATVGSTGRSTGPHVHYEVLKDGRQVDPAPFIARNR